MYKQLLTEKNTQICIRVMDLYIYKSITLIQIWVFFFILSGQLFIFFIFIQVLYSLYKVPHESVNAWQRHWVGFLDRTYAVFFKQNPNPNSKLQF